MEEEAAEAAEVGAEEGAAVASRVRSWLVAAEAGAAEVTVAVAGEVVVAGVAVTLSMVVV